MSAISEKIRVALFAKLNVEAVTDLATGGVFHRKAPESANLPYVIFQRQSPQQVLYALGDSLIGERDRWLIKALTDEDSSESKEPEELAEDILEACEAAIGENLTISENAVGLARRVIDMPDYTESLSDRDIYHHGFFLDVVTE